MKKFGETLVEATNGGTFFLIGRTNYSFLTGIMDFIIECRGVNAGFDNPAWCYVTSKFTEDGFETSEDVFKLPLE